VQSYKLDKLDVYFVSEIGEMSLRDLQWLKHKLGAVRGAHWSSSATLPGLKRRERRGGLTCDACVIRPPEPTGRMREPHLGSPHPLSIFKSMPTYVSCDSVYVVPVDPVVRFACSFNIKL
jgi:hypothetical protein